MKHLGDITKIKGCIAPVVDCIIGGSPCQDLSVAGKRAGLAGERSGLYMEQIRIIKEMRHKDEQLGRTGESIRPRYMVWENVPGAFSSNKGKDFAAVLEEAIKVADPQAPDVPVPEKGWSTSGCIMGDHWSVAWRVLDAQFWGVPQRRRRIALVADFGGQSAQEILFVRKGVSRDLDESESARKATSRDAEDRTGTDDRVPYGFDPAASRDVGQYFLENCGNTLVNGTCPGHHNGVVVPVTLEPGIAAREGGHIYEGVSGTLRANAGDNQMAVAHPVIAVDQGGGKSGEHSYENISPTLTCTHGGEPAVVYSLDEKMGQTYVWENQANTLAARDYKQPQMVCFQTYQDVTGPLMANSHPGSYTGQYAYSDMLVAGPIPYQETVGSLCARDYKGVGSQYVDEGKCIVERQQQVRYIVRRLTPLECERLQGYPDGWTDIGEWVDSKGKKHKEADSPRYKALGNSIAIPPWKWVLKRLCACYERDATMASLFDGIGGFPYIWEQLNGKGSCLWASEIEEFPMAVTKLRFGGSGNG